jgi:hypothetical protein
MSDSDLLHSIDSTHSSNVITRAKSAGEHYQLSAKGQAQVVSSGPAAASQDTSSASSDAGNQAVKGIAVSAANETAEASAVSGHTAADLDNVEEDHYSDSDNNETASVRSDSTSHSEDVKLCGLKKRPKVGDSDLLEAAYDAGLFSPVDTQAAFDFGATDPISPIKVAKKLDFMSDETPVKAETTTV